jgi:hypothetical protein
MNLVVQGGVPRCLCEWMSRKLINRDKPGASRLQMYYCARAALPAKWFMQPARACKFTPFSHSTTAHKHAYVVALQ